MVNSPFVLRFHRTISSVRNVIERLLHDKNEQKLSSGVLRMDIYT